MRFTAQHSSLLLLLLPALTTALSADSADRSAGFRDDDVAVVGHGDVADEEATSKVAGRPRLGTKDAPVDGKDGKPHLGPFVEPDRPASSKDKAETLPPLKGKPKDTSVLDGEKIPETNDNIMADKDRSKPDEGKTGTEGGVTEKDKARKEKGQSGDMPVTKPASPKEKPPMPHSVEEKLEKTKPSSKTDTKDKEPSKSKTEKEDTSYTGLEKPDDLPGKTPTGSKSQDSKKPTSAKSTHPTTDDDGIINPMHSFLLSFTMIIVSEIGDKTFLIAALMAMKHDRMVVFSAAFASLLVMSVLSASLGHAVPTLIPKRLTGILAAILFFVFGAKLLREGMQMSGNEGVAEEMQEVEQELAEKEREMGRGRHVPLSNEALEMGMGRSGGRLASPPRSPSTSPTRPSRASGGIKDAMQGVGNLVSLLISPIWVQTFVMTFLGEWGDRSQIATIAMAAGQDWWWVTLGTVVGHSICTGLAVIGGRALAGRVSMKVVTVGGAAAFILFGFIYMFEAVYS